MTPATVAVLDIGKSNVKLSACSDRGHVVETLSAPNTVLPGPPWRYQDLASVERFAFGGLMALAARHPLERVVATGHGSGCVLVGTDPDAPPVLPMIDYEQPLPPGIAAAYAAEAGDIWDRGGAIMMAATHNARQMFWAEQAEPAAFARAAHALPVPQYWAFRLSGVAVADPSSLGAQSQLWNVRDRAHAAIVARRGWERLMPPVVHPGTALGPIRPGLGLPALTVHAGAHDSSASFHRHQAAGQRGFALISTGTWIVALTDQPLPDRIAEAQGMTINADMAGRPVLGALTMGGREYATIAGDQPAGARADPAVLARLIGQGTFALPTFGTNDGQFPGSAGRGRLQGPPPTGAAERHALAVLTSALLTLACGNLVAPGAPWVLDGTFLQDPAFAGLVAALRPGAQTRISTERYGIVAGAAILHRLPVEMIPLDYLDPAPLDLAGLQGYARTWHQLAERTAP
jgi:sugar (pentulose or hexulose) kinase